MPATRSRSRYVFSQCPCQFGVSISMDIEPVPKSEWSLVERTLTRSQRSHHGRQKAGEEEKAASRREREKTASRREREDSQCSLALSLPAAFSVFCFGVLLLVSFTLSRRVHSTLGTTDRLRIISVLRSLKSTTMSTITDQDFISSTEAAEVATEDVKQVVEDTKEVEAPVVPVSMKSFGDARF